MVALLTATLLAFPLLVVLSGGSPARADQSESIANKVGPSLVFLETEFTARVQVPFVSGSRWTEPLTVTGNCTGYVVDPAGYVATAGHCVNNKDEAILNSFRMKALTLVAQIQRRDRAWVEQHYEQAVEQKWPVTGEGVTDGAAAEVRLRQPTGDTQLFPDWTAVDVVAFQNFDEGDNAVVKVAPPDGLRALVISDRAPEPGDEVVAVGFPGAVQSSNDSEAIAQPSYKNGTVSSRQTTGSGLVRTEISAVLGKGMSGGPTVDENGQVIGTNSAGASLTDERASFNFITDNIALRSYLEQNGVTLAAAPRTSSGTGLWIWLGPLIGVAVLALLAVAGLLIWRRKRPGRAGQQSAAGPLGPQASAGPTVVHPQPPSPQPPSLQQPSPQQSRYAQPGYPRARPQQPVPQQPGSQQPGPQPARAQPPSPQHGRPQQARPPQPSPRQPSPQQARPPGPGQSPAGQRSPAQRSPGQRPPDQKPQAPRPDALESQPTVLNQPLPKQGPKSPGPRPPREPGPPGGPAQ